MLGDRGDQMGKLIGRRQPRTKWGLREIRAVSRQVATQLRGYIEGRNSRIEAFMLAYDCRRLTVQCFLQLRRAVVMAHVLKLQCS